MAGGKAINPSSFPSEQELFQGLVKSAFEFLQRSIEEFSTSTKFSVIHFAISIELLFKAKLLQEHWSLLLDKPDNATKTSFLKGEAKTITLDQAIERLNRIASISIAQEAKSTFLKIASHRNKMVHFAHAGEVDASQLDGQTLIAEEQCAGWLAIRILLSQWPEFNDFREDIRSISRLMEGHRVYLQKVFDSKINDLEEHRRAGYRVALCPSCRFESVKILYAIGAVSEANCVVCRFSGSEIVVSCSNEDCKKDICFSSYDGPPPECPNCANVVSAVDIRDQLDTGEPLTKDNYCDHIDINCPQCSGYHTVVEHHCIYVCTECYFEDEEIGVCEWCNEGQLGGVPEHSYLSGCEFCDGRAGHDAD